MKKLFLLPLILLVLAVSACSNSAQQNNTSANTARTLEASGNATASDHTKDTITYQSEDGPIEVPAHPQRVVVLAGFAGNVMQLGVPLAGVTSWEKGNPRFAEALKDVESVSDEDLEKIIELEPDLIIGLSIAKNIDKLKTIAPTITYTYGKLDFLAQHLEIGKALNKEQEAQAWIDNFKSRASKAGEEIKAKIGPDATVSVIESSMKELYVFGDNWGRGTEILYQQMGLNMPEKVKESALKDGYYALSVEVLPQYAGDYLIFSKDPDADNSFQNTDIYKNLPAVKNNRVFEANAKVFYFNDALTLDYQLDFFIEHFLGK
ncbi:iron-hydroxamate ABC transporter substrate-binding protein [Paenibacillus sp. GCM10012307]|uniref:Iron-hydroxamate ABC transporter substrate-binding protein n=1 Tax=Paenibacillus roseus TaxID=2798579 RepID=A0A934MW77_9BACL|nr:iron-hydroxamate ABC transporter substrate-binding protein [Paenibacillus roseus]MBJ6362877.1 iron-hydroxamate ABC transporter substrate-binding protein [Paenibacillus roseus]